VFDSIILNVMSSIYWKNCRKTKIASFSEAIVHNDLDAKLWTDFLPYFCHFRRIKMHTQF